MNWQKANSLLEQVEITARQQAFNHGRIAETIPPYGDDTERLVIRMRYELLRVREEVKADTARMIRQVIEAVIVGDSP